jgi:hypothetical protein
MPNGVSTGWVDTASRAITQVGFPVVIAGVLLWFLLTRFQDNMNLITERMAANTKMATELIHQERSTFDEQKKASVDLAQQTILMGQIAKGTAALVELRQDELSVLKRIESGQHK